MTRLALIATALCICALICSCGSTANNSNSNSAASPTSPSASGGAPSGGSSGGSGGSSGSTGSGGSTGGSSGGSSGSGSAGSGSGSGNASPSALAFAGSSSNQFFGIVVDGSGNASTSAGSPHSVNGDNLFLAASGKLLFVDGHFSSNLAGDNITTYRSDANGALTNLGSITANGAAFIAADSAGKFVYASADTDIQHRGFTSPAMYGFAVDQNSGKLTALPGSPWALSGEEAGQIGVSPNGSRVCITLVLGRNNQAVQCYARHSDGTIDASSFVTPVSSSTTIPSFTFSSDGTHVISTDGANNMVHSSAIASSPNTTAVSSGGSFADGVALDASGHWLAVVNLASATVSIMAVAADGTLSQPGAPVTVGAEAAQAAFSQNGNYLFVTAVDGTRVYSFDAKAGLLKTLNSGNPLPGTGPVVGM